MAFVLNAPQRATVDRGSEELQAIVEQLPQTAEAEQPQVEEAVENILRRGVGTLLKIEWRQHIDLKVRGFQAILDELNDPAVDPEAVSDLLGTLKTELIALEQRAVARRVAQEAHPSDGQNDERVYAGFPHPVETADAGVGTNITVQDWKDPHWDENTRSISVGPDEEMTSSTADEYRSNKGSRFAKQSAEQLRKPEWHTHPLGYKMWADIPGWTEKSLMNKLSLGLLGTRETIVRADRDLVAFLRKEFMYMPRTPATAILMREKAKRFMDKFNLSRLTRKDSEVIVHTSVLVAMQHSVEDVEMAKMFMDSKYKKATDKLNQAFRSGSENSPAVAGPLSRAINQPAVKVRLFNLSATFILFFHMLINIMRARLVPGIALSSILVMQLQRTLPASVMNSYRYTIVILSIAIYIIKIPTSDEVLRNLMRSFIMGESSSLPEAGWRNSRG